MAIRVWVLGLCLATTLPAQRAMLPANGRARVDAVFSRFARPDSPGCAVSVSIADEPVLSAAYGMADLEHDVPLTPVSIFEPGSVSKQFTAAAVLLLVQQGKISLEDSIRKYVPELPEVYAPVTIRHMLNHTAGLRDWGSVGEIAGLPRTTRVYRQAHVLDILGRQRALNYAPGAAYSYSNSGYNLAGILVGRVAGKSLAEFTRESIFVPLGMNSSSWRFDFRQVVKGRAIAYQQSALGSRQMMPFEDVYGQGGMLTTVGDLLRWNANFTSGRVGGKALAEQQVMRGILTDGVAIAYAAGLNLLRYKGVNEVSHSGTTAAYNAWLGRYPDQGLSVAVLCNSSAANGTNLGHAVADIFLAAALKPGAPGTLKVTAAQAGMYRSTRDHGVLNVASGADASRYRFDGDRLRVAGDFGETLYERVEKWSPTEAELTAFPGEFWSEEAETMLKVEVEGSKLVVRRRPDTKISLLPTYKDGFEAPGLGNVRFLRDGSSRVVQLSVGESRVWDLRFQRR
jgi:CubicO group peptidase (beta-lactamase class C family)